MKGKNRQLLRKYAYVLLIGGTLVVTTLAYGVAYLILLLCSDTRLYAQSFAQGVAGLFGIAAYVGLWFWIWSNSDK